jgi:hypothetical protein
MFGEAVVGMIDASSCKRRNYNIAADEVTNAQLAVSLQELREFFH